jgi:hypothetical protein
MPAVREIHSAAEDAVLMHLAVAQANTRQEQMRQRVSTAEQVREMDAARAWYDARLPNLVSVRMTEEDARREYM